MQTITEIAIQRAKQGVFSRREAAFWVDGTAARLDALLKRAVGSGEIWRIHRSLYCLSSRYTRKTPDSFELAQRMYGPSYISLESALSWHGWIPEAVHTITSASMERSRTFRTPLGLFSFTRIPQSGFFTGVDRVSGQTGGSFFLATPLKALADYVLVHRCDWTSARPVVESLRVDEQALSGLTVDMFDELIPLYRAGRVFRFLQGLKKDVKP